MAVSAQVMSTSSCNLYPRYVTLPVLVTLMDAAACEGGLGADGALPRAVENGNYDNLQIVGINSGLSRITVRKSGTIPAVFACLLT